MVESIHFDSVKCRICHVLLCCYVLVLQCQITSECIVYGNHIKKSREEIHFLTVCVLAPSLSNLCSHHGHKKFAYVLNPFAVGFWLWSVSEGSFSVSLYNLLSKWNFWICLSPVVIWSTLLCCVVFFPPSPWETQIGLLSIPHCLHKLENCSLAGRIFHLFVVLFWSLCCWPFLLSSKFPNKFYKFLLLKLHWP